MNESVNNIKELLQEKILLSDIIYQQQELNNLSNADIKKISHEVNELKQEKILRDDAELLSSRKPSKNKTVYLSCIAALGISLVFFSIGNIDDPSDSIKSGYIIQNLRGDTIDTWLSWQIPPDKEIYVNVVKNKHLTEERLNLVRSTIMSEEVLDIDDSLQHKGLEGTYSQYYTGWIGALNAISEHTSNTIPTKIKVISEDRNIGDIVIILTDDTSGDGYSGFTKSIADEINNQILKSEITIYNIGKLSDQELLTISRHEFGHALGLAHSTAPEDLMHPQILTNYPYISECNLDAIKELYDGHKNGEVICQS